MILASLLLTVRVRPGFRSKKKTLRIVLEKLHSRFNVTVIEASARDPKDEAVIGVAAFAVGRREVREVLDRVAEAVAAHPRLELLATERNEH